MTVVLCNKRIFFIVKGKETFKLFLQAIHYLLSNTAHSSFIWQIKLDYKTSLTTSHQETQNFKLTTHKKVDKKLYQDFYICLCITLTRLP